MHNINQFLILIHFYIYLCISNAFIFKPIDDDYENYSDEHIENEESGADLENPNPEFPIFHELVIPCTCFF